MSIADWKGKIDAGIITIREDEFEAVLQRFPDKLGVAEGHRRYRLRGFRRSTGELVTVAVLRCIEQGTGEAHDAARDLLEDLAPSWLFVVGIAGGVPAYEFSLGDVIVSTRIADFSVEAVLKDHSREYALAGGPLHRDAGKLAADIRAMVLDGELDGWNVPSSIGMAPPPVPIGDDLFYGDDAWKKDVREKIVHHWNGKPPRAPLVTTGAIASSDRLIKDAEILQVWLKLARQIQAVEMESAGIYRAAQGREVPFLAIRGVSDVVGFKRHPAWTSYACQTAAAFLSAFLLRTSVPQQRLANKTRKAINDKGGIELSVGRNPEETIPKGYDVIKRIHGSGYSDIFKCKKLDTGEVCIIKKTKQSIASFKALDALRFMRNVNIATPVRIFQWGDFVVEELPYIGGISLTSAIQSSKAGHLERSWLLEGFVAQMLSVLKDIHHAGVIHRDIHPDNIYIVVEPVNSDKGQRILDNARENAGNHAGENFNSKYCVFGQSSQPFVLSWVLIDNTFSVLINESTSVPAVAHGTSTAPEQIAGAPVIQSDFYSFGATLFFAVTGKRLPPVEQRIVTNDSFIDKLLPASIRRSSHGIGSARFEDYLRTLISIDPKDRPTRYDYIFPEISDAPGERGTLGLAERRTININSFYYKSYITVDS